MNRWGVAAIGFVGVVMVVGLFSEPEPDDPPTVDLDVLVGMSVSDAEDYLENEYEDLNLELERLDYAPAGRYPSGDWIILAVQEVAAAEDDDLQVWALQSDEKAWYEDNPTMPDLSGTPEANFGYGSAFEPVDELLHSIEPPGRVAGDGDLTVGYMLETSQSSWPYPEATQDRDFFAPFINAYGDVVAGQHPAPKTPLRPGQLMAAVVTDTDDPPGDGGSVPFLPVPDDDDDDDFDVPDKLCPTRFC